ncbi:hypothetical protein Ndes2526B_g01138 [Nannochloris sp. 'desiccata']|nr:hypothetical protein KSW81_004512 [Chlorella desiccata (nom. nud.)]
MTSDRVEPKALPNLALLKALQLTKDTELQDLLCSLILSECVYKAVDSSRDAALHAISTFRSQFPKRTVDISAVQFCRKRVSHKYLLATGGSLSSPALYVAFMGTKELRDVAVDVALGPKALFDFDEGNGDGEEDGEAVVMAPVAEESVVAHGGFLSRAQGIPAASLLLHALKQNMRLVLCGHSLGGAVATLVMLRLLSSLQYVPGPDQLRCVTFGMPALGSPALGVHIDSQGWGKYFSSYALPEDPIPRMHLSGRLLGDNSDKVKNDDREIDEKLVETLYKEDTSSSSSSDGGGSGGGSGGGNSNTSDLGNAAQAEDNPKATNTGAVNIDIKNKSRWSALREVARKARVVGAALPRFTLPPFLSYAHFGTPLYLSSTGVTYSVKENISDSTAAGPSTTAAAGFILPRGLLATHRMPAYRSRVLQICQRYCEAADTLPNKLEEISSGEVKETFDLAPQLKVTTAETSLPILWTPSSTTQPFSRSYSLSNLAVNPLRLRRPTPSAAAKVFINNNSGGVRRNKRLPLEKSTFNMRVIAQGEGLDTCTGASLRFPAAGGGGAPVTVFGLALDVSRSKQCIMDSLNKILSRSGGNSGSVSGDTSLGGNGGRHGGGGVGRSLIHALGDKLLPLSNRVTTNTTSNQEKHVLPKIEFVFEVPAEALLQLQLLDATTNAAAAASVYTRMPMIELNLYSDFAKTPVSVQCIPQTAWILSLDTHLGDLVFRELTQAAREDADEASARLLQGRSKPQKQQQQQQQHPSQQPNNDGNKEGDEEEEEELSRKAEEGPLPSSWREKFLQRLRPNTNLPAISSSPSPLRSVMYRGLLITDISNSLRDSSTDDIQHKLQLATELLQWTAQRDDDKLSNSTTCSSQSQTDVWEDLSIPVHEYELDSLLQNDTDLSLGTRLKQQLRRAISAVPPPPILRKMGTSAGTRQRHVLWEHLLSDLLPFGGPDVVVILTSGDILKHPMDKSGGSATLPSPSAINASNITANTTTNGSMLSNEFNLSLLDAVHAVAVASGQCHATALLAIAAPEAKDPAYRRRLSFSSGLYGRPGAVVPIDWEIEPEKEQKNQPPSVLNISMLQAALLAHSSAAQISSLQRQARDVNSSGERAVKSVLRARL